MSLFSTHNTPSHLRSINDQMQASQQSLQQYQYASLPMAAAHYDVHAIHQDTIIVTPEIEPIPIENTLIAAGPSVDGMLTAECNYKNCNIMAFQTPQPTRMRRSGERHASRDHLDTMETGSAILPPPLFDETMITTNDGNMASGSTIVPDNNHPNSGYIRTRRHHRTIPRHFTTAEPLITTAQVEPNPVSIVCPAAEEQAQLLAHVQQPQAMLKNPSANGHATGITNNNNNNKKPTCQCPIQHVPTTYMGANHLNSTRNESSELFLSTLNRKHSSKSTVAKSTSFPNDTTAEHAQAAVARMFPRDTASGLINDTASNSYQPANATVAAPSTTASSSSSSSRQHSTLRRQKTPVKIPTISKQIGNNEAYIQTQPIEVMRRKHNQQPAPLSLMADPLRTNINDTIIVAKDVKTSPANIISKNEIVTTPFPIQLIESMGKSNTAPEIQKHPILPPKMSKINTGTSMISTNNNTINNNNNNLITNNNIYSSAGGVRIPTISKATTDNNYMIVAGTPGTSSHRSSLPKSHPHPNYGRHHANNHHQTTALEVPSRGERSKSLPRNDDRINMGATEANAMLDKSISSSKLNFTASNFPMLGNHYTLPKSSSSKSSLNSSIMDAVNKVPAAVNISGPATNSSASKMHNSSKHTSSNMAHSATTSQSHQNQKHHRKSTTTPKVDDKALPVCTTYKNCSNPKEHFLPNDTSLDDDYLSECENCKSAHGSRYYLDETIEEQPQETMTLQRKMDDKEEEQQMYYRTSSTLPTNTKQKTT